MSVIEYRVGRWKYQLTKEIQEVVPICVAAAGGNPWVHIAPRPPHIVRAALLTVRAGYVSDGPSGPTWDSDCAMTSAIIHDALYQLIAEGVIDVDQRVAADRYLRDRCISDGMPRWRAWIWYVGVRLFGWRHCRPR